MHWRIKLGPVRWDSRTGKWTLRSKRVQVHSRTRSERTKHKATRTKAKTARTKQRTDKRFAKARTKAERTADQKARRDRWKQRTEDRTRDQERTKPTVHVTGVRSARTQPSGPRTQAKTITAAPVQEREFADMSWAERGESMKAVGLCGQATQDGTACMRKGTCPPGTHHGNRYR